jgi:hypothetical protein
MFLRPISDLYYNIQFLFFVIFALFCGYKKMNKIKTGPVTPTPWDLLFSGFDFPCFRLAQPSLSVSLNG